MSQPAFAAWLIPGAVSAPTHALILASGGQDRESYDAVTLKVTDPFILPAASAALAAAINEVEDEESDDAALPFYKKNWFFLSVMGLTTGALGLIETVMVLVGHRTKRDAASAATLWHAGAAGWFTAWFTQASLLALHRNRGSKFTWIALLTLILGFGGGFIYDLLPMFGKSKRKLRL